MLRGHAGEVVCLQFDDNILVTGSTDSTIRLECDGVCECCDGVMVCAECGIWTVERY